MPEQPVSKYQYDSICVILHKSTSRELVKYIFTFDPWIKIAILAYLWTI